MDNEKFVIGIDYGTGNDESVFTVAKRVNEEFRVVNSGLMKDFDYSKYVATNHQVVGEPNDIEKFKNKFIMKA